MKIAFKEITGFGGKYQISNKGDVMIDNFRLMKKSINKYGYYQISLVKNGKKFNKTVHQLVAIEFIENPKNYKQVNHKDCDKLNNCVDNLEWCNGEMNISHGVKNRLFPYGENSSQTKFTLIQVREIRNSKISAINLAKIYGVARQTINNIKNRKTWKYDE